MRSNNMPTTDNILIDDELDNLFRLTNPMSPLRPNSHQRTLSGDLTGKLQEKNAIIDLSSKKYFTSGGQAHIYTVEVREKVNSSALFNPASRKYVLKELKRKAGVFESDQPYNDSLSEADGYTLAKFAPINYALEVSRSAKHFLDFGHLSSH